jgi:hypothetical protein
MSIQHKTEEERRHFVQCCEANLRAALADLEGERKANLVLIFVWLFLSLANLLGLVVSCYLHLWPFACLLVLALGCSLYRFRQMPPTEKPELLKRSARVQATIIRRP